MVYSDTYETHGSLNALYYNDVVSVKYATGSRQFPITEM
jgi:hypothetical protein